MSVIIVEINNKCEINLTMFSAPDKTVWIIRLNWGFVVSLHVLLT